MISQNSRYANCTKYKYGDREILNLREPVNSGPHPDDRFHKVIEGERIDILAYKYFGDPKLWWVICDYNHISFPLDLQIGQILRIPSVDHLNMSILN